MFHSDVCPYYQLRNQKLTCPSNPIVDVLHHRVEYLLPGKLRRKSVNNAIYYFF